MPHCYKYKLTAIILFVALFASSCAAQLKVSKSQNPKEHKENYTILHKKMGLSLNAGLFYSKRINLNKYDELKDAGVDLRKASKKIGKLDYLSGILFTDVAIIGTIVGREYNIDPQVKYHTKYKVIVEEIIKGFPGIKDEIEFRTISGALDNNTFLYASDEPEFNIGEKALLYLYEFDWKRYEEMMSNGLYFTEKLNLDKSSPHSLVIDNKFTIKQSIIYRSLKESLGIKKEVTSKLKKLLSINSAKSFDNEKF